MTFVITKKKKRKISLKKVDIEAEKIKWGYIYYRYNVHVLFGIEFFRHIAEIYYVLWRRRPQRVLMFRHRDAKYQSANCQN